MASFSETQVQLQASAKRYLERRPEPSLTADEATKSRAQRSQWGEVAELGWLGAAIPEALGGFGGETEMVVLAQEIGAALASDPFLEAGVFPAVFLARSAANAAMLERLVAGELVITGASFGPDAPAQSGVRFVKDKATIRLSGALRCVLGADLADYFLVAPQSATGDERVVLLIERKTPNLKCEAFATIDGRSAAHLDFEGVTFSGDSIVAGGAVAVEAFDFANDAAILGQCAELVGLMGALFEMTRSYLLARRQFGQPLASFQALRHRLADMYAELEQGRAMLNVGIEGLRRASALRRSWAISACKLRIGQAARYVGAQAIQLHGAIAMTEEYKAGRYYKRMLAIRKIWGDEDFHATRMMEMRKRLAASATESEDLLFSS